MTASDYALLVISYYSARFQTQDKDSAVFLIKGAREGGQEEKGLTKMWVP